MPKTARRFGREDSDTRALLLVLTEKMMRTQGYAAVTSRTLASAAGVKPALVHYYFRTMDDLFIALLRDRGARTAERYQRALTSARPLRELWKLNSDPLYVASGFEFMALANHRKAIRAEIARFTKHIRALQTALVTRALESRETGQLLCPPTVIITVMEGLARALVTEQTLGFSSGHRETLTVIKQHLRALEALARPVRKVKLAS